MLRTIPVVDRAEMLRYLGYGGQQIEPELSRRIELVVERLELDIEPRGVRRVFAVDATGVDEQSEPCIRLVGTNVELRGRDIYRHLKDARFAALMACTSAWTPSVACAPREPTSLGGRRARRRVLRLRGSRR